MIALDVRVAGIRAEAQGVKAFTLRSATDEPLPAFSPGAHIEVRGRPSAGKDAWRAYSIASDASDTRAYEIGVLRIGEGGVSAWLHDQVRVDDLLTIAPPRNDFPLAHPAASQGNSAGCNPRCTWRGSAPFRPPTRPSRSS